MFGTRWERLGAIAGILFFVVVLASFFTPETPDVDDPTAEIVNDLVDDRTGIILSAYLVGLASLFYLVFVAALWSLLRRAEAERGPSVLVLLGGLGIAMVLLVSSGVTLALVEAADEGREEAIPALIELDNILFILGGGITIATFYAGVALSAIPTGSLPRWLGWIAAAFAVVFPIALLGVFSEDDEGGVLGAVFFIVLLVNFLWILAASIVMLLRSRAAPGERPAATAPPP
jgi:hypothetical protein